MITLTAEEATAKLAECAAELRAEMALTANLQSRLDKTLAAGEEYYSQLMEERKLRHSLELRLHDAELVLSSLGAKYERTAEGIRWWRSDPDLPTDYTTIVERHDPIVEREKYRDELRQELSGITDAMLGVEKLCSDCPAIDYPTDETRCAECPRREGGA